jgi:hypothetical protein
MRYGRLWTEDEEDAIATLLVRPSRHPTKCAWCPDENAVSVLAVLLNRSVQAIERRWRRMKVSGQLRSRKPGVVVMVEKAGWSGFLHSRK